MGGTKSKVTNVGRILPYEEAVMDEKMLAFKRRIEEQIKVLRIAINSDDVNDPQMAENYAKKAERFLAIPFICDKKNKEKTLQHLKTYVKMVVSTDKEILGILKEWIQNKKDNKIVFANKYILPTSVKDFEYAEEFSEFIAQDIDFLNVKLPSFTSELVLVNKIIGFLADKEFLKKTGIKNSWKVRTLKEFIVKSAEDYPDEISKIEDCLTLPYFRYKKYLELTVKELEEVLNVRAVALQKVIDFIEAKIEDVRNQHDKAKIELYNGHYRLINNMLYEYDRFMAPLIELQKVKNEEYSLYRFGQGLIEADIFGSLYK